MNTRYYILLIHLLLAIVLVGCRDENWVGVSSNEGIEGEVTIRFCAGERSVIVSRTDDAEVLDNVVVYALDGDGKVLKSIYQQLDNRDYVTMYLPSGTVKLIAVCNYDYPDDLLELKTEDEILNQKVEISKADEAYKGCYVMSGELSSISADATSLSIPVYRIAARFSVDVFFKPEDENGNPAPSDVFDITSITLCDAPNVTWLMRKGYEVIDGKDPFPLIELPGWDAMVSDENNAADVSDKAFLSEQVLDFVKYKKDNDDTGAGVGADSDSRDYSFSFNVFENRRGGLDTDEEVLWSEDLIGSTDTNYRQLLKKKYADRFPKATYLKISGVYNMGVGTLNEHVAEVTYYIYLGVNNYSDYNVWRNCDYKYEVTIKTGSEDGLDTRIVAKNLENIKLYASALNEPLDAHFNAVEVMLYARGAWEMYVKEPDKTPWLEISTHKQYYPNLLGDGYASSANKPDKETDIAGYSLGGKGGMNYIYIHTDEYIPEQNTPQQNDLQKYRTGIICYREIGGTVYEVEVKQYPAQLVILDYYDALTVKHVKDTFFVERILEEKNIEWGFKEYWSLTMDNLITTGQWDGLSNTRKLFETAIHGDGFEGDANDPGLDLPGLEDPAYPGVTSVPTNIAVGYAIGKNRDRNGNGRIDYDEIVWYMPAMKELEAIYEHLERKEVDFEATTEKFASSTPSAAGPNSDNPGRFYYIKMATGDLSLAMRNRAYNVLCCRRKGAWQGNADAGGGGDVTIPDDGYGDEDFIMPKTETSN